MEDVLAVYHRPYDPARPVVCLDECPKTLHGTPRGTLPADARGTVRQDYEYSREGTCNTFLSLEPLAGWAGPDSVDTSVEGMVRTQRDRGER